MCTISGNQRLTINGICENIIIFLDKCGGFVLKWLIHKNFQQWKKKMLMFILYWRCICLHIFSIPKFIHWFSWCKRKFVGPLQKRNMFFIKGFLEILKDFVRQYAQPKRNMMKSYLIQETITKFRDMIGDLDEYAPQVWK